MLFHVHGSCPIGSGVDEGEGRVSGRELTRQDQLGKRLASAGRVPRCQSQHQVLFQGTYVERDARSGSPRNGVVCAVDSRTGRQAKFVQECHPGRDVGSEYAVCRQGAAGRPGEWRAGAVLLRARAALACGDTAAEVAYGAKEERELMCQVTWHFYMGLIAFMAGKDKVVSCATHTDLGWVTADTPQAEQELTWALDHCPFAATRNVE